MRLSRHPLTPFLWLVCLLVGSSSVGSVHAQTSADNRAAAQVLFDEAVKLRDGGNLARACPKFAESVRLDPGPGARFNLADCYERMGKLASAWTHFLEVLASVEMAGQSARLEAVRQRVRALEPRLSRLVIQPHNPVAGLVVERDGSVVGAPQWSTAVPVDAGTHRIQATAPGYLPWRGEQLVQGEGQQIRVVIPELVPAPVQPKTPDQGTGDSPQATIGWVVGAAGLVGLGVGVGFGIRALAKKSAFDEQCPNAPSCSQVGLTLRDEGITAGTVSTIGFIAGGVLAASGVVLVLTAPSADDHGFGGGEGNAARRGQAIQLGMAWRPNATGGQWLLVGRF